MTATPGEHRPPARWRAPARRLGGTAGLAAAVLLGIGPAAPVPPAGPELAAEPPAGRTVTVHGGAGSFGSLGPRLPSGQPLGQRAVSGWGLPAGSLAGPAAVAADGTVFVAGQGPQPGAPAPALAIGAYQPATGAYHPIMLPAGTGQGAAAGPPRPAAPPVAGLTPVAGGQAVAFTTGPAYPEQPAGAGAGWPVLGILTKLDGRWQVAGGPDWANQWTGGQLRASRPPASERACPAEPGAPGHSHCRGLGELISLPGSGHLIVAQAGSPGWYNGQLLALRLAGPDPAGRFTVTVAGNYLYPNVRDPVTGDYLDLAFHGLQADPTGRAGGERFVVGLRDLGDQGTERPMVLQEFSYDQVTGQITPVSAPTVPGDRAGGDGRFYGYSAAAYDQHGNLWAARHQWLAGGPLAVHLGGLACPYDPVRPPGSYRTSAGDRTVWGQTCRPDYDLRQAQELTMAVSLMRDPAGGEVVALGLAGGLLPVRASGPADRLTFHVGNLVDTGLQLLPAAPDGTVAHRPGGFDPAGRLWLPATAPAGHWLYEVRVADLFDPAPVPLPEVPGEVATIQAGHTVTTGTEQLPGTWATTEVVPDAYVRACTEGSSSVGCSYDGLPGDGYLLGHPSGFGHLAGQIGYRVAVPVAGRYRVAYRVATFEVSTDAEIMLSAGGRVYRTPVATGGRWLTVPLAEPVTLPAGVHTIRIAPPEGGGGWFLNFLTLQRA